MAIAIGIEAVQAGLSVYFANAGILIERLKKANSEGILEDKDSGKIQIVIAAAMLDRILHHCTTINIKGEATDLKIERNMGLTIPRK